MSQKNLEKPLIESLSLILLFSDILFCKRFLPASNKVRGKVIFSVACVKNSVHWGGLPQCMLEYHPPGPCTPKADPPGPYTPRADPPGTRHPPPRTVHAGRYGLQVGGMHPTGMKSCCK